MFDFIRNHSRLTLAFLLLLVLPSFVVFGIEGYSRFVSPANTTVAKTAGHTISLAEWEQAHERVIDRLRRQNEADTAGAKTAQARLDTLDQLLRDRVLLAAAGDLNLFPPVPRMQHLFDTDPQFAGLRGADGRLSREALAGFGMTPEMFDQRLRQDYGMRQVLAGVALSGLVAPATAELSLDALLQRREVQLQRFDTAAYRARVNPGDAQVEAYYKAHEDDFRAPEQAQIEYVTLDYDALGRGMSVSDDDARKFYDADLARFTPPQERRASHILIQADPGDAAAKARAKERAEALLKQARDKPSAFAELAKKNSQDTASAPLGGDLEFARRGAMASKALEDAIFGMKVGEVAGPVETEFGYHVVMLTAVRGGQPRPFDEVKAEVQSELRKAQIAKRWPEAAEQFTNIAYEQPDSLQPLIDKFKLEKKTATVMRQPVAGATGALASARFLQGVFSADAVKNKRNTDAVEVGANQLAAARIVQHQPSRVRALAEVRPQVRERVIASEAAALARKEGEARLAALRSASEQTLPETVTVSRQQSQGLPGVLLEAVLHADPSRLPHLQGIDLGMQGYAVLRVTKVLPPELPAGAGEALKLQVAQTFAAAETDLYLEALKRRYKTEVKPEARSAAAAAAASSAGF